MTLPGNITTITVTGTYLTTTGSPAAGFVTFDPGVELIDSTGQVILGSPVLVALNSAGQFSVILPCTDNTTINPGAPWVYTVTQSVSTASNAPFQVSLPHTLGTSVDISALAQASTPPTASAFATANTWTGEQTFAAPLVAAASLAHQGTTLGFYDTTPAAKPTVSGSKGGNAALASLMSALSALGLVTDTTT